MIKIVNLRIKDKENTGHLDLFSAASNLSQFMKYPLMKHWLLKQDLTEIIKNNMEKEEVDYFTKKDK